MSLQTINIGAAPNDMNGDTVRMGGQKINANFKYLDEKSAAYAVGEIYSGPVSKIYDNKLYILNAALTFPYTTTNFATELAAGNWSLVSEEFDLSQKADLVAGKVPASQLPSYVDDVIEVANAAARPAIGETGKIYITTDTNKQYRWGGTAYVEISASTAVWGSISGGITNQTDLMYMLSLKQNTIAAGTTSQYWRGDKTWQTLDKNAVGLDNVDNTSDANKPVSSATQTALDAKQATLVSGTNIKTINGNSVLGSGDLSITANTVSLEFNAADLTVWNNGKGNVVTNTSFGDGALRTNVTGNRNTAIGYQSLFSNTIGSGNLAIGDSALFSNLNGSDNIALGRNALNLNIDGNTNVAIGNYSLNNSNSSYDNTAIGYLSLRFKTSGWNNVAIGSQAGNYTQNGTTTLTVAGNSVFIGQSTKALNNSETNQIVIGYNAIGAGSNSVVLGNTSILKTILRGSVGIGTESPNASAILDLTSTTKGFLAPRMNNADRDNMASTAIGLIIYNTSSDTLDVFTSAGWKQITGL